VRHTHVAEEHDLRLRRRSTHEVEQSKIDAVRDEHDALGAERDECRRSTSDSTHDSLHRARHLTM
jgi:hypothetical protein